MTRKLRSTILAAIMAATIGPAAAQSEVPNGGARVEAKVGIDLPRVLVSDLQPGGITPRQAGSAQPAYGFEAGYDLPVADTFFAGIYAGFSDSENSCTDYGNPDGSVCLVTGRSLTVGLRAGVVAGPMRLFAKGGYSNDRLNAYRITSTASNLLPKSGDLDGFHIGAGLEVPVARKFYVKGEYDYVRYDGTGPGFTGGSADQSQISAAHRHRLWAGAGIRF